MAQRRTTATQRHLAKVASAASHSDSTYVTYPVRLKRDPYLGEDALKRHRALESNQAAQRVEKYINDSLKSQSTQIAIYTFQQIADETGMSVLAIRELCQGTGFSTNGFRGFKPTEDKL